MSESNEEKLVEHVFNGSLAIQAVLIAVAGIVAAGYEKVSILPDVERKYRWFLIAIAFLSLVGCLVSLLALARARGRSISIGVILGCLRLLIVGVAVASVGIVVITIL